MNQIIKLSDSAASRIKEIMSDVEKNVIGVGNILIHIPISKIILFAKGVMKFSIKFKNLKN